MKDQIIICPNCKFEIPLSEAITEKIDLELRKKYDSELIKQKEKLEEKFQFEISKITEETRKKFKEEQEIEITDLQNELKRTTEKLKVARDNELKLREREREIEDKEKNIELELKRKIDEEKKKIEEKLKERLDEDYRFKEAEKEKVIGDLKKQIDELRRKAEQGSQQTQGEVLELKLEDMLNQKFPMDLIDPVPKGIKGPDLIQRVCDATGVCGTILWESKNTKNWSNAWIKKLKRNQIDAKAEICVLLTATLPKEINHFGYLDGVWVTNYLSLIGLTSALRMNLIEVAIQKRIHIGKDEKMEVLYNYLSSHEFKHKIEAIGEAFIAMQRDLDQERRAMENIWAKREKQIEQVMTNTTRIYGDMQGLMGNSLAPIKILQLPEGN